MPNESTAMSDESGEKQSCWIGKTRKELLGVETVLPETESMTTLERIDVQAKYRSSGEQVLSPSPSSGASNPGYGFTFQLCKSGWCGCEDGFIQQ